MSNHVKLVGDYLLAGFPILYTRSSEQERAYEQILSEISAGQLRSLNIFVWKANTGLVRKDRSAIFAPPTQADIVSANIMDALKYPVDGLCDADRRAAASNPNSQPPTPPPSSVYIFFNIRPYLAPLTANPSPQGFAMIQQIRDAAVVLRSIGSHIIFIGSDFALPSELSDIVTITDFELPTKEEIKAIFTKVANDNKDSLEEQVTEDALEKAAEHMVGVSLFKAENAIALSIAKEGKLNMDLLQSEKQQIIRSSGTLQWVRDFRSIDELGGFDILKNFVAEDRSYFERRKQAQDFGLDAPKGIMMVGNPGTGKTLAAKCIASVLGLKLYSYDMGSNFTGIVGGSEERVRATLKMLESLAPCVALFDEFDKGMAGLESSGRSDSGVTSRVIGTILTWMSECTAPIYKIATANTIRNLDGAIFRKGRWDEVFMVDLPQTKEREEIFAIHLKKRKRDPEDFELRVLAKATSKFIGAEIEAVVQAALKKAFHKNIPFDTDLMLTVIKDMVPISTTDAEAIQAFREWGRYRARPVSSVNPEPLALAKDKDQILASMDAPRKIARSNKVLNN